MKVPRSPMFYFFAIPFTSCAAIGMYSIYDSPMGRLLKSEGTKCLNYMSETAITAHSQDQPDDWWFRSSRQPNLSEDSKKKPPPMPY
jgi:hypothetical protein